MKRVLVLVFFAVSATSSFALFGVGRSSVGFGVGYLGSGTMDSSFLFNHSIGFRTNAYWGGDRLGFWGALGFYPMNWTSLPVDANGKPNPDLRLANFGFGVDTLLGLALRFAPSETVDIFYIPIALHFEALSVRVQERETGPPLVDEVYYSGYGFGLGTGVQGHFYISPQFFTLVGFDVIFDFLNSYKVYNISQNKVDFSVTLGVGFKVGPYNELGVKEVVPVYAPASTNTQTQSRSIQGSTSGNFLY